jgi:malonyl-CoA O-methyltransferase
MSIAAAFGRAVDYDRHAIVQARVAERLAEGIAAHAIRPGANIFEIGCGTGLLGAALIDRIADARWLMTDISPAMVARTAQRFAGDPRVETAVMDGEFPDDTARYDLICSSLAMQWFGDLAAAIPRLGARLAPGGMLAFTTLAEGSFAEWRDAHDGASAGTPDYPSAAALEKMGLAVSVERYPVRHADARAFLRSLKAIGAGTPRTGHRALAPAILRRVMRRFEAMGATATYVVANCRLTAMEEI